MQLEMFDFFEMTPVLVCIAGKDGFLKRVNPAVTEKLGYTATELYAHPVSHFIYHEDKIQTSQQRAELLTGKALLNFQNRYVAKDGSIIWLEWNSIYFPEKEVVFAIAKDITERKLAEIEIQEKYVKYKSVATHFKSRIEDNRKYIAIELHEELAQLAAIIKMDLEVIAMNESGLTEFSQSRLEHATKLADLLINAIKRISFSISPNMLRDLGLKETLKWHCNEFTKLNNIPCQFAGNCDEQYLTPEVKFDFFRICQEAFMNIMFHAQATQVVVTLEDKGNEICLSVSDDGKGFNVQQKKDKPGITIMQERARSINGSLQIDSAVGRGTVITVCVNK
jgi:PAS domain S-box-containing protein